MNKAFAVAAVCGGLVMATNGLTTGCSGVFYTPVCAELGFYRGTFAFHATLLQLMIAAGTFFVPWLYRKLPFKAVLAGSVLIAVTATGLMGQVKSLAAFYALSLVRGAATAAFATIPINHLLNAWFTKGFGTAASLVFCGTGVGAAGGALLLTNVIQAHGWRTAYAVLGLLILACCLPAILLPYKDDPAAEGRVPYGGLAETVKKAGKTLLHRVDGPVALAMLMTLICGFITAFSQHFTGYAESVGLAAAGAGMLSAAMIGNIASKLVIGPLSDRKGAITAVMVMFAVCTAGMLAIPLGRSTLWLWAGAFFYGSCNAVTAVGLSLLIRRWYGQSGFDSVFPYLNLAGNAGAALALAIIGYIYDFTRSYLLVVAVCTAFAALAAGLILALDKKHLGTHR